MDIAGIKGAAETLHKTVEEAIPAAEQSAKNIEDHAIYGAAGIIADVFNRLTGAKCPVDLTAQVTVTLTATAKITGQIGSLQFSVPDYEVK